jgi:hypothetical protein
MPYIKPEDRQKYAEPIADVIEVLKSESSMSLGLHYGHFVYCLVRRAFGGGSGWMPLHDSPFHSDSLKNIFHISKYTAVFHALLPTDRDQRMGELNYVLSTIAWGLTEKANYATRSYVKGALLTVMNEITVIGDNAYHSTIVRGVLSDVVDEMYRRRTAIYEDGKKDENGDILPLVYTRQFSLSDFDHYCPGEPLSEFEVSPDVNISSPAPPPPPRGE